MGQDNQGASFGPGSHPSGHAASGVDGASRFDPSRKMSTSEQCAVFGCDLIDLLRREGSYSGVWFGDRLLQVADILESTAYRTSLIGRTTERVAQLEAALRAIHAARLRKDGSDPGYGWSITALNRAMDAALALLSDSDRNPKGEDAKRLSAEHESAGRKASPETDQRTYRDGVEDEKLEVKAFSADLESKRILLVHFRNDVRDQDRQNLLAAINLFNTRSLASQPPSPMPTND